MKLPSRDSLVNPDHQFLYDHDCRELHNPKQDFSRLTYVSRFDLVLDVVQRWAKGRLMLDVGCAQGNFSLTLAELDYKVVAVDLRHTFLQYLRLKHERGNVYCAAASVEALPFRWNQFDVVLLGEVIEHVAYPRELLSNLVQLLVPGGILVLTTPNGDRFHTGLPTYAEIRDPSELVDRQFRPDADGHLFLLTRNELIALATNVGFEVVKHQFFCTPWLSGRLMARHVSRFLPIKARSTLDQLTIRSSALARLFSEGQLIVARRPKK